MVNEFSLQYFAEIEVIPKWHCGKFIDEKYIFIEKNSLKIQFIRFQKQAIVFIGLKA